MCYNGFIVIIIFLDNLLFFGFERRFVRLLFGYIFRNTTRNPAIFLNDKILKTVRQLLSRSYTNLLKLRNHATKELTLSICEHPHENSFHNV